MRRFRIAGVLVPTSALLLGGCVSIPTMVVSDSEPTVVAATIGQSEEFFTAYSETNNAANAAQDAEQLATIETGTLLNASRFGFAVEKAQGMEPTEPFTVAATGVAAPEFSSYPLFYLASATKGDSPSPSNYLLLRQNATEPWKAAAVVDLAEDDDFDLTAAVGTTPTVAAPEAIDAAHGALDLVRQYAETGEVPEGLDAAGANSLANLPTLGYAGNPDDEGYQDFSRTCRIEDAAEGAWLETDTGVLGMAVAECTQHIVMDDGVVIIPDGDFGTIPSGTEIAEVTISGMVPFVAEVSNDGQVVVHGGRLSLTRTEHSEG